MAFKNSLKVLFGKGFFLLRGPCASFLARLPKPAWPRPRQPRASRFSRTGPPRIGPAQLHALTRLPRAAPFPCWSPRHATTAAENFHRVATTCRRRPPRGSRGLAPRPRARLHLLVPARSLTPARVSSPPLQSQELELCRSPRPQLRRR